MTTSHVWQHVPGKALLVLINIISAVALVFEGYNQGVYGTVSGTPGFIEMAGIGHDGILTDSTKQGGLAAAYYFGGMWGCFAGGEYSQGSITCTNVFAAAAAAFSNTSNSTGLCTPAAWFTIICAGAPKVLAALARLADAVGAAADAAAMAEVTGLGDTVLLRFGATLCGLLRNRLRKLHGEVGEGNSQ